MEEPIGVALAEAFTYSLHTFLHSLRFLWCQGTQYLASIMVAGVAGSATSSPVEQATEEAYADAGTLAVSAPSCGSQCSLGLAAALYGHLNTPQPMLGRDDSNIIHCYVSTYGVMFMMLRWWHGHTTWLKLQTFQAIGTCCCWTLQIVGSAYRLVTDGSQWYPGGSQPLYW